MALAGAPRPSGWRLARLALPGLAACLSTPLRAQPVPAPAAVRAVRVVPESATVAAVDPLQGWGAQGAERAPGRAPWWAAAASAVVPGAGQAVLRQPHGIVYAAVEAYMWLEARDAHRFSNQKRDEYREIARTIARRNAPGSKPDGDWDYYERLEKLCKYTLTFATRCLSSGAYDRVAGGDVDPETDINTFNGQIWGEAVKTYMVAGVTPLPGTPEYQRALAAYKQRAEQPDYLWSWVGQQQQQDVYRQAIQTSNQKYDEYQRAIYVIIANHVLSSVDALMTVRVRRYGRPGVARERRTGFEASLPWAPFGRPGTSR